MKLSLAARFTALDSEGPHRVVRVVTDVAYCATCAMSHHPGGYDG